MCFIYSVFACSPLFASPNLLSYSASPFPLFPSLVTSTILTPPSKPTPYSPLPLHHEHRPHFMFSLLSEHIKPISNLLTSTDWCISLTVLQKKNTEMFIEFFNQIDPILYCLWVKPSLWWWLSFDVHSLVRGTFSTVPPNTYHYV